MTILEQINAVVEAREAAAEATNRRMDAYGIWLKEHEPLFASEKVAKEACEEAETQLREMTIQVYTETGSKTPAPGVGIRETTRLEYSPEEALKWATSHQIALKLDTSAFEKIAKASPLEFVKVNIVPQATIATELSRVLQEAVK